MRLANFPQDVGATSALVAVSKMTENYRPRVRYVIGPDGSPLTVADLPPRDTKRWVIRRKAEVVAAVRGGLISSRRGLRALHADGR